MFPQPGPRQRLGSGCGAFLWSLAAVLALAGLVWLAVAYIIEHT